jgi:hypothetical protein
VAGAGIGPAEVEKDVEEHRDTEIVCVAGTSGVGSFAHRYRVDQPRTQIKRKGNSGDGDRICTALEVQVYLGWWEGGSEPAAQPPSPCPARGGVYKARQDKPHRLF